MPSIKELTESLDIPHYVGTSKLILEQICAGKFNSLGQRNLQLLLDLCAFPTFFSDKADEELKAKALDFVYDSVEIIDTIDADEEDKENYHGLIISAIKLVLTALKNGELDTVGELDLYNIVDLCNFLLKKEGCISGDDISIEDIVDAQDYINMLTEKKREKENLFMPSKHDFIDKIVNEDTEFASSELLFEISSGAFDSLDIDNLRKMIAVCVNNLGVKAKEYEKDIVKAIEHCIALQNK